MRGWLAFSLAAAVLLVSTPARADLTGGVGATFLTWTDNDKDVHPSVTFDQKLGFRVGYLGFHIFSNLSLGNWGMAGDAYGWLVDHSKDYGNPIYDFFAWFGLAAGYMTAWLAATDITMAGPMLTIYPKGPGSDLALDFGVGPAIYIDEIQDRGGFGVAVTGGVSIPITDHFSIGSRLIVVPANHPNAVAFGALLIWRPGGPRPALPPPR